MGSLVAGVAFAIAPSGIVAKSPIATRAPGLANPAFREAVILLVPPANHGVGPLYGPHRAFTRVIRGLHRFPRDRRSLLGLALVSPVTDNRRAAAAAAAVVADFETRAARRVNVAGRPDVSRRAASGP